MILCCKIKNIPIQIHEQGHKIFKSTNNTLYAFNR
ncbi:hypothetical protein SATMO3_60150 [Sporomusa aerivorans]